MRNLNLLEHISQKICGIENYTIVDFCVDTNENILYVLTQNGFVYKGRIKDNENIELNFYTQMKTSISISHLPITSEVCIVDEDSITIIGTDKSEYCHMIESGCKAVKWSPDQNLLTVVTNNNYVRLYSVLSSDEFHIINQHSLSDLDFIKNQFVTVGWGKKETQFHGSEGKAARTKAVDVNVAAPDIEDVAPRITWRDEGDLFAVGFLRENSRVFIVFNNECQPQFASEACPGLEAPLAWRPSGNLIAGVQRLPNKYQIVFFEKNGLRHGEFTIDKEMEVKKLLWGRDSEVLCLRCDNTSNTETNIQLWSVNNYHWYRKQNLVFSVGSPLRALDWDSSIEMHNVKCLRVLTDDQYISYRWVWDVNRSVGTSEKDQACVAVIDGRNLLVTAFRKASIPPPMCAVKLEHDRSVNAVMFSPNENSPNDLCTVLDNFFIVRYAHDDRCSFSYEKKQPLELPEELKHLSAVPLKLNHWLWFDDATFFCSSYKSLYELKIVDGRMRARKLSIDKNVISLNLSADRKRLLIQCADGSVLKSAVGFETWNRVNDFPHACQKMESSKINDVDLLFGLDDRNRFYVNEVEVANNITSFFIQTEFLLLTTSQHALLCYRLNDSGISTSIKNSDSSDVFKRSLERGSRLVIVVQRDRKTVLQMPRGNLETIYPRAMSVHTVVSLIDSNQYKEAFIVMKTERINFNLLFDHDPEQFLENIDRVIDDVADTNHLNMFLSDLVDEDVTSTMYASCYYADKRRKTSNALKRQNICDSFIDVLSKKWNSNYYLLTIITAYVAKRTITDLESALRTIQRVAHEELEGKELDVSSKKAIGYLVVLSDINQLYDVALGLYDFDLAMMLAGQSQKDPKEYVPFLNELRQMDPHYRRYTVDKRLKRFDKALESICKCPDKFDECKSFVAARSLHKKALEILPKDGDHYRQMCSLFAQFLAEKHCYSEAGLMYQRSGDTNRALSMYVQSSNWNECIVLATSLNYDVADFYKLCRKLCADLVAQRRRIEAAVILNEYLKDYEEAVAVLTDGRHWPEVLRLIYFHKRLDMIETHLKPGIIGHGESVINQLESADRQFRQQRDRLRVVRSKATSDRSLLYSENAAANDVDDLFSDANSVVSRFTQGSKISDRTFRSFRSSKNQRKHERKMISLKEGSPYEDMALVQSLHALITTSAALREEVHTLCAMLLRFDLDAVAKRIQRTLDALLKEMKSSQDEIWKSDLIDSKNESSFGPNMTTDSVIDAIRNEQSTNSKTVSLDPQYRYAPVLPPFNWKYFTLD